MVINFDELMRLHNEAKRKGYGSKEWFKFSTTIFDSFSRIYETAKSMNNRAAAMRGYFAGDDAEEHF